MNLNSLSEELKKKNLRLTNPRKQVYQALEKSDRALSAGEVFKSICEDKKSQTDLVSVYRNLSLFFELGIAHRFQDGRYTICRHQNDEQHDHDQDHVHILMNCEKCGKSSEVKSHSKEISELASGLMKIEGPLRDLKSLVLQGICKECK